MNGFKKFFCGFLTTCVITAGIGFLGYRYVYPRIFVDESTAKTQIAEAVMNMKYTGYLAANMNYHDIESTDTTSVSYEGMMLIDNYQKFQINGKQTVRTEKSAGSWVSPLKMYGDIVQDRLLAQLDNDGVWHAYDGLNQMLAQTWWHDQLENHMVYEGICKDSEGRYRRLMTGVYDGTDLKMLIDQLHLCPYGHVDASSGIGEIQIWSDVFTYEPLSMSLRIETNPVAMTVLYPGRVQYIDDFSMSIKLIPTETVSFELPENADELEADPIAVLFGEQKAVVKDIQNSIVSNDGHWKAGFMVHSVYDVQHVEDNVLNIVASDQDQSKYRIKMEFGNGVDVYTDTYSDAQSAKGYFEHEGLSEILVTPVKQTVAGDHACYWYQQQYTDMDAGFVHQDYVANVDLDDGEFLKVTVSASFDRGQTIGMMDQQVVRLLEYVWVEEGADK